jgi:DNA-binding LytR/AlgR family response regulator
MTTALIAEDEPILAATLAAALQRLWPELSIVAQCANGIDALAQAEALRPDVLFLDIKMPGKSGLEVAGELADNWSGQPHFPHIVFVTAYDEFAVQAFDREAADYVLKPVSEARLGRTVARLRQRLQDRAGSAARLGEAPGSLESLAAQLRALGVPMAPAAQRLSVIRAAVGNQVRMVPVADVVYFEAADKYVNVVTADSEVLIRMSLRELLPQLDDQLFWQVHRGTIVNSSCVLSALREEGGKLSLVLRGRAEKLRVSPLYAHLFRQM